MAASLKSGFFLGSGSPQPTEQQNNPKMVSKERRFRVTKNSFIKKRDGMKPNKVSHWADANRHLRFKELMNPGSSRDFGTQGFTAI